MPGTLACIGVDLADPQALTDLLDPWLAQVEPSAVGASGIETTVLRDASGAMLSVTTAGEDIIDLVPSFAGPLGVRLGGVGPSGQYLLGDVEDDEGQVLTRVCFDSPQRLFVPRAHVRSIAGSMTLLAGTAAVHADAEAFTASEASLLGPAEDGGEVRLQVPSLIAYGMFTLVADGEEAPDPEQVAADVDPRCRLVGTVVEAEQPVHSRTGQSFHAITVQTLGMKLVVCGPASLLPESPPVGAVIEARGLLVGDAPVLWKIRPPKERRGLLRRR
ncbi:hypothetical protein [Nocardioides sp.]|uniref:hypothetical protein n=1 Tax=Nocardioides sp. TaxID=35761 RepID=UPI0035122CE9